MRAWKLLGLAGIAGVAATGAVLARNERQRRGYAPDDVRARLHDRHAALADPELEELAEHPTAADPAPTTDAVPPAELAAGRRHRLARRLRRR